MEFTVLECEPPSCATVMSERRMLGWNWNLDERSEHFCPDAPVLRPTFEEWADFATYVQSIEPAIRPFGGCQIIPPPGWEHQATLARTPGVPEGQSAASHRLAERLAAAPETRIKPIRQHVVGRSGIFQAVMELMDAVPLHDFVADSSRDAAPAAATPEELDSRFWRHIAGAPAPVYGADASELGSLFEPNMKEWHLGALPGGPMNDLTQSLPPIPGLNRSMLYFGRWRSFFAMHTEDCELQGASYLHCGAPKRWYVVPPAYAERVRTLTANLYPEARKACAQFLRHKTTLLAPAVLKRAGIPVHQLLQTEGTFVLVLASALHWGFNHGPNLAEAVNFGLAATWLPRAVCPSAAPCTCDGGQTPYIDVALLIRKLKHSFPQATRGWWVFHCACGELRTSFDDETCWPEGVQFECVGCGTWSHAACYPQAAHLAAAASATVSAAGTSSEATSTSSEADVAAAVVSAESAESAELYCIACLDAWRDVSHQSEAWTFTCVCGRHEGVTNASAATGDAPSGRMFECDECGAWSHTECYPAYKGVRDEELPDHMPCHRCAKRLAIRIGLSGGGAPRRVPGKPKRRKPAGQAAAVDSPLRKRTAASAHVTPRAVKPRATSGGAAATDLDLHSRTRTQRTSGAPSCGASKLKVEDEEDEAHAPDAPDPNLTNLKSEEDAADKAGDHKARGKVTPPRATEGGVKSGSGQVRQVRRREPR